MRCFLPAYIHRLTQTHTLTERIPECAGRTIVSYTRTFLCKQIPVFAVDVVFGLVFFSPPFSYVCLSTSVHVLYGFIEQIDSLIKKTRRRVRKNSKSFFELCAACVWVLNSTVDGNVVRCVF